MKSCTSCNKELLDTAVFCGGCGTKQFSEAMRTTAISSYNQVANAENSTFESDLYDEYDIDTETNVRATSHPINVSHIKMAIACWSVMLILSVVRFQVGEWSYFSFHVDLFSVLPPIALLIGSVIAIQQKRDGLLVFPLVLCIIIPFIFGGGVRNVFVLLYLGMIAVLTFILFWKTRKYESIKPLMTMGIICAGIWCGVIVIGYPALYNMPMEFNF
jgi:hypothetical protein